VAAPRSDDVAAPRRILVTGANGFVGRHLLPALAAHLPGAEPVPARADLADAGAVEAEVRRVRPEGCVHLAAVSAVGAAREDPDRAWRVNVLGTLALARALLAHAPACLLVFASSADAYGASFQGGAALAEDAPLAPLNPYAATKAAADLALGAMVPDGLRVVRVRAFNHTGPGQAPLFAVPAFARQAARVRAGLQAPVLQVGNLEPRRDFLDVRDVCAAYALCLARGGALPWGAVLNLASGEARRIGDVLDAVLGAAGVEARIETSAARVRGTGDVPVARGDAALARRVLGWSPRVPWPETLRDVVADWHARVANGE
jgi:GDP-4-dehydro-6-deoxy-D-mannose reductase